MNCRRCGEELTGRQRVWCSVECQKINSREQRLQQHFHLSLADYNKILDFQHGKCAVCSRTPKPGKALAVDHDHQTGFVRGLLCFACNKRLLGARSDRAVFALAAYLREPPAKKALGRDVVAPGRPPKKRRPRRKTVKR